jgi:hypothetical protein
MVNSVRNDFYGVKNDFYGVKNDFYGVIKRLLWGHKTTFMGLKTTSKINKSFLFHKINGLVTFASRLVLYQSRFHF